MTLTTLRNYLTWAHYFPRTMPCCGRSRHVSGLSGLLARHLSSRLHRVDELHVAMHGAAGPACARVHHRSLSGRSPGYIDGEWKEFHGGSGCELCWFPEPVGAVDCYRAESPLPILLHRAFPEAQRISSRRSARRLSHRSSTNVAATTC